jgi:serine/threonine protein kinase/tetratricopeptide (TPR) repeat protein
MLAAGTQLGPYSILASIGAGGMGEVYRARDTRLDRDVAIKVLPEHLAKDPTALARFQVEARAIAALVHPNVLVLYDVGSAADVAYVVMEYLEGETLRARLSRGPLPWRKAVELGMALAGGLGAAHAKGIIHRDLKPGNIFLTTAGQLKILDFGLAIRETTTSVQAAETGPYIPAITDSAPVYGTLPYMSPEQLNGETADARSDIFALGCVLYEMVTGQRAFAGKSRAACLAAIMHEEPPPFSGPAKTAPADLEPVIRHCLEKNPEERFQSARDVAFALRSLLSEGAPKTSVPAFWPRRLGRAAWIGSIVLLLAAAVALYLYFREDKPPPKFDTVAVLPFVNEHGDENTEYLSDGMADNLIRNLSQVRTLKVRPFSSVMRYKGKQNDVAEIGRALKVGAVVAGRVQKRGQDLVVRVELIDVGEHRQLWGDEYHRKLGNLIALQEEMAKEIADNLRLNLSGEEKQLLTKRYTESAEAHRVYLLARYYWNKRTKEGLNRAINYLKEAIAEDPRFALAYAGLADCYNLVPGYGYNDQPPRVLFSNAKKMATKALKLDETLAEAHTALAFARATYDWDWQGAENEYQRAIELKPNYATCRHWYACLLSNLRRFDDAYDEIRRAQDIDPSSLIINGWVAMVLCYANRMEEAVQRAKDAVQMDPDFAVSHYFLAITYRKSGRLKQAIVEFKKAVDRDPHSITYLTGLGGAYALSGQKDKARKILEQLAEQQKHRYVSPYGVAAIHAALGNKDEAILWLNKAFEERDEGMGNLQVDSSWDGLRSEPRFQDLVRRMKFPTPP